MTHRWSNARKSLECSDLVINMHQELLLHHLVKVLELKIAESPKAKCENKLEVALEGLFKLKN